MPQIVTRVSEEMADALDKLVADGLGRSRSDVVRRALEDVIDRERRAAIGRAIVDGYTRIPDDGEFDDWAYRSAREAVEEEPW